MSNKLEQITRERILKLLSDDEVAKVSMAQTRPLAEGEDYVALDRVHEGVRKVDGTAPLRPGDVLPRSAVSERTWQAIVSAVA